jgi:hypothetical protein
VDISALAETAGALVVERSTGTSYGTLDLDLPLFANLVTISTIRDCRDMFVKDSVSWNLLNEKLIAFNESLE